MRPARGALAAVLLAALGLCRGDPLRDLSVHIPTDRCRYGIYGCRPSAGDPADPAAAAAAPSSSSWLSGGDLTVPGVRRELVELTLRSLLDEVRSGADGGAFDKAVSALSGAAATDASSRARHLLEEAGLGAVGGAEPRVRLVDDGWEGAGEMSVGGDAETSWKVPVHEGISAQGATLDEGGAQPASARAPALEAAPAAGARAKEAEGDPVTLELEVASQRHPWASLTAVACIAALTLLNLATFLILARAWRAGRRRGREGWDGGEGAGFGLDSTRFELAIAAAGSGKAMSAVTFPGTARSPPKGEGARSSEAPPHASGDSPWSPEDGLGLLVDVSAPSSHTWTAERLPGSAPGGAAGVTPSLLAAAPAGAGGLAPPAAAASVGGAALPVVSTGAFPAGAAAARAPQRLSPPTVGLLSSSSSTEGSGYPSGREAVAYALPRQSDLILPREVLPSVRNRDLSEVGWVYEGERGVARDNPLFSEEEGEEEQEVGVRERAEVAADADGTERVREEGSSWRRWSATQPPEPPRGGRPELPGEPSARSGGAGPEIAAASPGWPGTSKDVAFAPARPSSPGRHCSLEDGSTSQTRLGTRVHAEAPLPHRPPSLDPSLSEPQAESVGRLGSEQSEALGWRSPLPSRSMREADILGLLPETSEEGWGRELSGPHEGCGAVPCDPLARLHAPPGELASNTRLGPVAGSASAPPALLGSTPTTLTLAGATTAAPARLVFAASGTSPSPEAPLPWRVGSFVASSATLPDIAHGSPLRLVLAPPRDKEAGEGALSEARAGTPRSAAAAGAAATSAAGATVPTPTPAASWGSPVLGGSPIQRRPATPVRVPRLPPGSEVALLSAADFSREVALGRVLGAGGAGCVLEGGWRGRRVAVKIVHEAIQTSAAALEEFCQEIETMARLGRHPRIVSLLAACTEPPYACLIQELAGGGSLHGALHEPDREAAGTDDRRERRDAGGEEGGGVGRRGSLPGGRWAPDAVHPPAAGARPQYRLLLSLLRDVAEAMVYCHGHHPPIVHRDLKPHNVLLDASRTRAMVADFGLARAKAATFLTRDVAARGTAAYMAPEAFALARVSERCDVWAWGALAYECLTGREPWSECCHVMQIVMAVGVEKRTPAVPLGTPPELAALLRACWRYEPDLRPSFAEILTALDGMLRAPRLSAKPLPLVAQSRAGNPRLAELTRP